MFSVITIFAGLLVVKSAVSVVIPNTDDSQKYWQYSEQSIAAEVVGKSFSIWTRLPENMSGGYDMSFYDLFKMVLSIGRPNWEWIPYYMY